jgi:monooxygenase
VHELATMLEPLDLPQEWTHEILRRQYVTQYDWLASVSRDDPAEAHEFLMETIKPLLPEGTDVEKHFTPAYRPWQQRIVIVPDGDFFESMRDGSVSVVTDTITEFTEKGVQISSGEVLEADVVVTATGFDLAVFGDIPFTVDGEPVDFANRVTWRGLMISGVPNMAYAFGYFRHSWTLRVDLVNDVVERIFARMAERGASTVEPQLRPEDEDMPLLPWVAEDNFNAGYVMRGKDRMFRQGDRDPWTHMHEHDHERAVLPEADLDDGLQYR